MNGDWLFLVFWLVPSIAGAIWAWNITELPLRRGWEASKVGFGLAASIVLFGIPQACFWLFVFALPFLWAFDKVDRHFGGRGIYEFDR